MLNALRMDMYQIYRGSLFRTLAILVLVFSFGTAFVMWFASTPQYAELVGEGPSLVFGEDPAAEDEYPNEETAEEARDNSATGSNAATDSNDAANTSSTSNGDAANSSQASEDSAAGVQAQIQQMTQVEVVGGNLVGGSMLALLLTIFAAIIITNEFNSGFIKNVLTTRVSRSSYFMSKAVSLFSVALALTVLGTISTLLFCALFRLTFVATPIASILLWILCVSALATALSLLVALVAWISHSKVAAVLTAVAVSTSLLVGLLGSALTLVPSLEWITDYTLGATLNSLASGLESSYAFGLPHVAGVALAFLLIYGILGFLVVKRKDI